MWFAAIQYSVYLLATSLVLSLALWFLRLYCCRPFRLPTCGKSVRFVPNVPKSFRTFRNRSEYTEIVLSIPKSFRTCLCFVPNAHKSFRTYLPGMFFRSERPETVPNARRTMYFRTCRNGFDQTWKVEPFDDARGCGFGWLRV